MWNFLRRRKPALKAILTVSPVPMTATAMDAHVLSANMYSKSVLRAAAGHLSSTEADIDYFPSYEIIAGTRSEGRFYGPNKRTVLDGGVRTVMDLFFAEHGTAAQGTHNIRPVASHDDALVLEPTTDDENDVVCEDAFSAFQP